MESDHGTSHGISGGVGIEAAVDLATLADKLREPERVLPGAGGRDATVLGMDGKAAEGVDGGLTEDDFFDLGGGDGEVAEVFSGAGHQAMPGLPTGSPKLGADRGIFLSKE